MVRTAGVLGLVAMLLTAAAPTAAAQDAGAALPAGCRAEADGAYACEWVVDPAQAPERRVHEFALPLFGRTDANITVAADGYHAGWMADVVVADNGTRLARVQEVGEFERVASVYVYPILVLADPDQAHVLRFSTEVLERERLSPEVPEAIWPGSMNRFRIAYAARALPDGIPAPATGVGFDNPHVHDERGDAPRPYLDILAAWLDDPRVGDGTFEAHVVVADLSDHPAPDPATGRREYARYILAFTMGGANYRLEWAWPAGNEIDWQCELRREDDDPSRYARRVAAPFCAFDVDNSRLSAWIPEVAVGSPTPDVPFLNIGVRAERTRPLGENMADVVTGGEGTFLDDDTKGQRLPFHLAAPATDDDVRLAGAIAPGTALSGILPFALLLGAVVALPIFAAARRRRAVVLAVLEEETREFRERRRELYRASLERMLDDRLSLSETSGRELAQLRLRLGLKERDHEEIHAEVIARLTPTAAPERDAHLEPGAVVLGRYRIETLLGEGGGGRTYRCKDTLLGRVVALKEIDTRADAQAQRAAIREARSLASVRHPRVVTLLEVHEAGERVFLVMEYMEGGSLAQRLRASGPPPHAEAARVMRDILEGLVALHAAHLLHRDIKPSNILLDAQGRAKLTDLGIARPSGQTTIGGPRRMGTPMYMAPEQVLELDVDQRVDVYAAAALLYELLAGEPYVRPALREGMLVEEAIVSRPPPLPLAGAPAWADRFLREGLHKDPARRPQTAAAALALVPPQRRGPAGAEA